MIKLKSINHQELKEVRFDFLIVASGYETRCRFLSESFNLNAFNKFSLGFENEKDDLIRLTNDEYFSQNNFISLELKAQDSRNQELEKLKNG